MQDRKPMIHGVICRPRESQRYHADAACICIAGLRIGRIRKVGLALIAATGLLWQLSPGYLFASDLKPGTQAQSPARDTHYYSEPPSQQELADQLFPPLTRSIVVNSEEPVVRAVAMPVLFHFGKATITDESRPFLDVVGEMLTRDDLSTRTLIVEGHTDATGPDEVNLRLSELRALAVKHYLVRNFNIDPRRLFPEGRGEQDLAMPAQPEAGVNRRVEFLPWKAP